MIVWRLAKAKYPALDGEGARRNGGRWNSPGRAVVYTAATLSLAILELLVHTDSDIIPEDLLAFEIEISTDIPVEQVRLLPDGWDRIPAPEICQSVGDKWIDSGRGLLLAVPSVIVPLETNYLLNPSHADMSYVRIANTHPFNFDHRLFG